MYSFLDSFIPLWSKLNREKVYFSKIVGFQCTKDVNFKSLDIDSVIEIPVVQLKTIRQRFEQFGCDFNSF